MANYYKILEIAETATKDDIKKAYKKLAMRWHPDKNPKNLDEANRKFKEIAQAYEILSDDQKRRAYDAQTNRKHTTSSTKRANKSTTFRSAAAPPFKSTSDKHFDFSAFDFRSPYDIFKEFFSEDLFPRPGGDPLISQFGTDFWRKEGKSHHKPSFTSFIHDPFKTGRRGSDAMDFPAAATFPSWRTKPLRQHNGRSATTSPLKQTTTVTTFRDGKTFTTKKIAENNVETTQYFENNKLISTTTKTFTCK